MDNVFSLESSNIIEQHSQIAYARPFLREYLGASEGQQVGEQVVAVADSAVAAACEKHPSDRLDKSAVSGTKSADN